MASDSLPRLPATSPSPGEDKPSDLLLAAQVTVSIFAILFIFVTFFAGVCGNGLVIWVAGFRLPHTVNRVWFLNLAVADLAFTLSLPVLAVVLSLSHHWVTCRAITVLLVLNLFASVFQLSLIAVDRCVCMFWPLWARRHRTPGRAALGAGAVWLLALACMVPDVLFFDWWAFQGSAEGSCYKILEPRNQTHGDGERGWQPSRRQALALQAGHFTFGFLLPLILIGGCSGLIAFKLWRRREQLSRPFRVLASVVTAFFICWFPFHLLGLLQLGSGAPAGSKLMSPLFSLLGPLAMCLVCLNSCLNPLLYAFLGRDFREHLVRSLPAALERSLSEEPGLLHPNS
ncbi:formyl peptide receptor-related sequence 4-like [Tachyglossus aculeatus]|uniref:formyl peptide receptor-related sequence 4-like n=1 Tax=Tachyglossus aculeatus TaxID=9261 RepID=UPI0018F6DC59|nr:formyl peptide receptor-related sequence 4-like [Tachyglossus aculeatus]